MTQQTGPRIRLHPSGHVIPCADGATVLESLEQAGFALPNNCRAGACGECKVRVRSGTFDQGFVLDMALSREDRAAGYGLMCMAKPLSAELEIEWGTAKAQPILFPPRESQEYVLVDRLARTPRISELVLRPLAEPMRYWPGQYVLVGGAPEDPARTVPRRAYSLAAAPRPDGEIRLQVTRVDDGRTSAWLHARRPGEIILVSGPYGTFIGDPSVETPVLCLAAGSGLAPILSLTEAALRRDYKAPVTLMFSGRHEEDIYDLGLMRYWAARHPNFRYLPTLTRARAEGMEHGRIPEVMGRHFPDLSEHSVFIAGTPGFVSSCVAAARALGARDDVIHTEGFSEQQG